MGDETRDVTAIKLLMRNERQYRRLYVLGFVTEPAHSGMQPALPIPVETLAPPWIRLFVSGAGVWLKTHQALIPKPYLLLKKIRFLLLSLDL